jgi:putative hydrolase of the HAD superfamily
MIKAVIFDLDDVLIYRTAYFSKRLGLSEEKINSFFGGVFQDCLTGKADLKEELPKVMKEWGWEKSMEELLEFWFVDEKNLDEKMIEYIHGLKNKGVKVFIGTNNERHRLEYLEKEIGLGNIFHKVYGSYLVGYVKPDPAFYNHILQEQGLEKDEVLFWDDNAENIASAQKFGIRAEIFTTYENFEKKMREYQL